MGAYNEVYLSQVIEEQGKFFERLQDIEPPIDSAAFITAYMHSDVRKQLDDGQAWYLTLNADGLKRVFLETYQPVPGEPLRGFMPIWIGRFYAYAQWVRNVSSAELCDRIPVKDLAVCYPGAHDQSLEAAVEKLAPKEMFER